MYAICSQDKSGVVRFLELVTTSRDAVISVRVITGISAVIRAHKLDSEELDPNGRIAIIRRMVDAKGDRYIVYAILENSLL